jgi:hypothetical protein
MNIECIFLFLFEWNYFKFFMFECLYFLIFFNWMLLNFTFLYRSCLIKVNKILKHTKNSDNKFLKLKENKNKNKKVNCPNLLVLIFFSFFHELNKYLVVRFLDYVLNTNFYIKFFHLCACIQSLIPSILAYRSFIKNCICFLSFLFFIFWPSHGPLKFIFLPLSILIFV